MSTRAIMRNSSPEKWLELPMPADANVSWPGRAFARAMSSFTLCTGTDGWMTRMFGAVDIWTTGAKSLSVS